MSGPETFLDGRVTLHCGDSRDVLRTMADASVHSVVCDPPYALVSISKRFGKPDAAPAAHGTDGLYARASAGFMGQAWDTGETAFAAAFWREVLRVLKPGGHVAAFASTRTYHRLAVAIEDAGFEIRDQLAWMYGSGFPKSHDVSKGIDRLNGDQRPVVGRERISNDMRGGALLDTAHDGLRPAFERDITSAASAASAASAEWEGYGTALKPAWEPICLGRKPLVGTVAANVLAHRTGALNIDGCRIAADPWDASGDSTGGDAVSVYGDKLNNSGRSGSHSLGRWPANIVHDGSDCVRAAFPAAPGALRAVGPEHGARHSANVYGDYGPRPEMVPRIDLDPSTARFFYTAKADADDRIGSNHPTVKPVDLMRWLVRLVTPPGGLVLDPFSGTGTTGEAVFREGFRAVLIEREPAYCGDIRRRMSLCLAGRSERRRVGAAVKAARKPLDLGPLFAPSEAAE